jgi:P27 family predicted phage terminase small subunit
MASRGRPRKPIAQRIFEDSYRPDRHGDAAKAWQPAGAPKMPTWLDADGSELWQSLAPTLTGRGVATAVDAAELGALCDWWSRYRAASRALDAIADKQSTEFYRVSILASMAWKNFAAAASKFGLNPADRARLRITDGNAPKEELVEFATQREA